MRQTAIMLASFVMLLALTATGQESRSEISVQGTRFFTQDTNGQGLSRTTTDTGGFQVGYRYHINRWLAAEGNYGFNQNTQRNSGGSVPGAGSQGKGAFLYGAGADYALTRRFSIRAEYRGFVYKNPDFGLAALHTDSWTHTAQPSAGIVFRF